MRRGSGRASGHRNQFSSALWETLVIHLRVA